MESFVPFGGFFSTPSNLKGPLSDAYQHVSRCQLCNDKCEQELTAVSKGVSTASVADQYQSSLPSWLQMAELSKNKSLDDEKAKDDGALLSDKVRGLQKKWDSICHRLHHSPLIPEAHSCQVGSQVQTVVGFQFIKDRKGNADNFSSSNTYASLIGCERINLNSCMSIDLESISTSKHNVQFPLVSMAKKESLLSKLLAKPSKTEDLEPGSLRSSCCSFSNSSAGDGRASPTSATSVMTDLGLGTFYSPTCKEPKSPNQHHAELKHDISGCFSANVDLVIGTRSTFAFLP